MKQVTKLGLTVVVLLIQYHNFAQSKLDKKLAIVLDKATSIGVSKDKIAAIKQLVSEQDSKIKAYHADWVRQDSTSLIYFYDKKISPKEVNRQFREDLAGIITKTQYAALFQDILAPQLERDFKVKWQEMQANYTLTPKQEKVLRQLVKHHIYDMIVTRSYYNYNSRLAHNENNKAKAAERKAYEQALVGMKLKNNIKKSNDPKLAYFIRKAKEAGISNKNIQILLDRLAERDQKMAAYHVNFQKFQKQYLVYFHDQENSKEAIGKKFRREMAELITLDQFSILFGEQLANRIKRKANRELQEVLLSYKLSSKEKQKIKTVLKRQATKKVMTWEYYGYDIKLAQQKLRALQYRAEKEYKETLKAITNI